MSLREPTLKQRKRVRGTPKCTKCLLMHENYYVCPMCVNGGMCQPAFEKSLKERKNKCHACNELITPESLINTEDIIGKHPYWFNEVYSYESPSKDGRAQLATEHDLNKQDRILQEC